MPKRPDPCGGGSSPLDAWLFFGGLGVLVALTAIVWILLALEGRLS